MRPAPEIGGEVLGLAREAPRARSLRPELGIGGELPRIARRSAAVPRESEEAARRTAHGREGNRTAPPRRGARRRGPQGRSRSWSVPTVPPGPPAPLATA